MNFLIYKSNVYPYLNDSYYHGNIDGLIYFVMHSHYVVTAMTPSMLQIVKLR